MKSMMKILVRYVLSAAGIALILLVLNLIMIMVWMVKASESSVTGYRISEVADSLTSKNGVYELSELGKEALEKRYQWAMLLNDQGQVIWSQNLPADIPRQYTAPQVASFTRWYLNDYPVYVWQHADGLLVLGTAKGSRWKAGLEMSSSAIDTTLTWVPVVAVLNALAAVLLAILLGLRLFRSLRTLARGIEDMANKKAVKLPTSGLLGDLADRLNQTSGILQQQDLALRKRDNARAVWITGISHDIRTPLSMIMGYASQLEENSNIAENEREQAGIIRRQSEKIKALVNDLNLTSKLEYEMQPLQQAQIIPAKLLRNAVADFINNNLDERYKIDLEISPAAQELIVCGDEKLLGRVISNLINNSIEHNPHGCTIYLRLGYDDGKCRITVNDDGKGFSPETISALQEPLTFSAESKQGLGLTIVRQILKAHEGTIKFSNLQPTGCSVCIELPLMARKN